MQSANITDFYNKGHKRQNVIDISRQIYLKDANISSFYSG